MAIVRTALWQVPLFAAVFACLYNPWTLLSTRWSGDNASYISHAFTLGMDLDLDYSNELVAKTGPLNVRRTGPIHPIGAGLLAAPWVGAFSLVDRIQGHAVVRDHLAFRGSWAFFGFFVASAFALLAAAWLYIDAFEAMRRRSVSRGLLLLLIAATGVPYYGLQRFTMSHSFEFLTIALTFWGAARWVACREGRLGVAGVAMAAGTVLTIAVRPSDLNILLLPPVVWLAYRAAFDPAANPLRRPREWLPVATTLVLGFGLLMGVNRALYGVAWPSMSDLYGPAQGRLPEGSLERIMAAVRGIPYLLPILFSSEFGLFYSAPVIPVGVGLLLLPRRDPSRGCTERLLFLGCLLSYVAIPLAIVFLWRGTGSSYGYRYLLSLVAPGLLGFILWRDRARTWIARLVVVAVSALCILSLAGQAFFQTSPVLSVHHQVNVFGKETRYSANGYVSELVRQIGRRKAWMAMLLERLPGFVIASRTEPTAGRIASTAAWGFAEGRLRTVVGATRKCPAQYPRAIAAFSVLYLLGLCYLVHFRRDLGRTELSERSERRTP